MKIIKTKFKNLLIIKQKNNIDRRGNLREIFNQKIFKKKNFVFEYCTSSKAKVLRGFHFQYNFQQAKYVNVLKGKILDCVVDLRKNSKTFGKTFKIINETEVKNYLIKKGFSIIALSELSFLEQINLFSNAKQIIGLHGAGFANLVFCKPETLALEVKSEVAAPVIGNLAKKLGLKFKEMSIKPEKNPNNDQQGLIYVSIKDLEKKLIST